MPQMSWPTRSVLSVMGIAVVVVAITACGASQDDDASLSPSDERIAAAAVSWVQHTDNGPQLRVVAAAKHCPSSTVNGVEAIAEERVLADPAFPVATCSVDLAPGDSVDHGRHHHEVPGEINRIVVFGSPACELTACDMEPFAALADDAAAVRPDLAVFAGDLLADPEVCFEHPGCRPPSDDRWATWKLHFFEPAAPLLEAAPVVFARGVNQGCSGHAYEGWGRLIASGSHESDVMCRSDDPAVPVESGGSTRIVAVDLTGEAPPNESGADGGSWLVTGVDPTRAGPIAFRSVLGDEPPELVMWPSTSPEYLAGNGEGVSELRLGSATGPDATFWLLDRRGSCWSIEMHSIEGSPKEVSSCPAP